MNLTPLTDRVLVKRIGSETITKFGIVIPDVATEKSDQAIVLAVGRGIRNDAGVIVPLDVKVNDRILFNKNSGTEVAVNDEKLLVLKETDIFGVIE